jgi:acetyl esterase/lipase
MLTTLAPKLGVRLTAMFRADAAKITSCSLMVVLVLAGPATLSGQAQAADDRGPAGRPVVLLFHAGGFLFGDAGLMSRASRVAARHGLRPVPVEYPLGAPARALHYSLDIARKWRAKGRAVYAYGESAGGTLAALLAERAAARAAVPYAPVADMTKGIWAEPPLTQPRDELVATSPALHRSRRPILVLISRHDPLSHDSWQWAESDPLVDGRSVSGHHISSANYPYKLRRAMSYLARQAERG